MSEWKNVKLGDILQIKKGDYITKKDAREGIYPVILGGKEPAYYIDKYNHTGKAIVVSRSGASAGFVSFWNEPIFVTDGFLIEPKENITFEFLYYALKSKQALLHNAQKGAAIPHVTPLLISDIDFLLPNEMSQHRIATILSRYDSLIENYQKQIKLLEEAAQRLYKEWFVDLHFPGHETTKIVDGVPEGWEKKTLDEYCSVFTGKKNANAAVPLGKYKFFTCGETPLQIDSFIYDGPAIIISGNGSYTGRTTFYEGKFDLYQRTYACTINNNDNKNMIYGLFEIVKCELTAQISGGTHGAAIPYIVMGDVTKFTFTSNDIVLRKFSKIIKSFLDRTICISSQIRLLTEARDRLLPKLMNGEIKV